MIDPILVPAPLVPTSTAIGTDPLGMNAAKVREQSEEQKARLKELAKAEAEFAAQHVAEQAALTQAINRQLRSNRDASTVPVLGDAVDMLTPDVDPIREQFIPFDMPGGMELRGYLDENGNATPEGELFVELMDSGIFDDRGQLTAKGKAYVMDPEEAEQEENLQSFIIRDKAGLNDDDEVNFGTAAANVGSFLWDAVKGGTRKYLSMTLPFSPYDEAEIELSDRAMMMGGVKSGAQLGAGLKRVAEKIMLDPGEDETAYYYSKQAFRRDTRALEEMQAAEFVGGLLGSAEVLSEMEQARQANIAKLGPEKAAEIEKQAGAFGQLVLDPSNAASFGAGFFASKAAQGPTLFARLSQTVEKATLAKATASAAQTAAINANATATRAARIAELAAQQADNLASIGDDAAAQAVRGMASRNAAKAAELAPVAERLSREAAERLAVAEKLAMKAGGAEVVLGAVNAAKQARAIPLQALGATADAVGSALIKTDEGIRNAIAGLGFTRESAEAARTLKWAALGGGIAASPFVATIAGALAAGPTMKQIGNMARIMGKETLAARGSIPYWRRVSQAAGASPLTRATAHLLDEASLGAKVLPLKTAAGAAKGAVAAAPVDLAFEILAEGGELDANTVKQALAESLVFGGTGGAFGAMVTGSRAQKQRQALGDEINFKNTLTDSQAAIFRRMGAGSRRVLSTYAANFPSLNVELTDTGNSSYDSKTLTAKINVNQSDWLKPLVAHEVNHYVMDRAQMTGGITALLLGTEGIGGLVRSADGTLDPRFAAAMTAYNDRLAAQGQQALTPEEFAVEYFNEGTVDELVGMAESGELSRLGGMTDMERFIRDIAASLVDKTPIVRDLAMKLGSAKDKGGNLVQGNGLLADGVRELPGAKKLLRQMLRKTAGRKAVGIDGETQVSERGVKVPEEIAKGAFADTMIAQFEFDGDTVKRDKDGNPIPIDRGTELKRATAGLTLIEMQEEKIRAGQQLPEGSLQKTEEGDWVGEFLTPEQIRKMETSGVFNAKQLAMLRGLNAATKTKSGETFAMVYQPAIARDRRGKVKYASLSPTFREVVPLAVRVTKAGNIIIETMSVTQLMENVRTRAESKMGKRLYNGSAVEIMRDVEAVLELHKQRKRTDDYFKGKYGEGAGPEHKNFINLVFGLMTKEQQSYNPLFESEKIDSKTNVFKSRRLDRINQTAKLQGRPALPFGYTQVKENWFPLGLPPEEASYKGENLGEDYRIQHRPMTIESGAAGLHEADQSFGPDIYTKNAMQYFGSGDPSEKAALRVINAVKGKPNAIVTIYRGVPDGVTEIKPGDWVALDKESASLYGNVLSKQVKASEVTTWPDSLAEFGYYPEIPSTE